MNCRSALQEEQIALVERSDRSTFCTEGSEMEPGAAIGRFRQRLLIASDLRSAVSATLDQLPTFSTGDAMGVYISSANGLQIYSRGVRDSFVSQYVALPQDVDPVFRHACTTGYPAHELMIMSSETWAAHPLYEDLARPCGLGHYLAAPILSHEGVLGAITLARGPQHRPFTHQDVSAMASMSYCLSVSLNHLQRGDVPFPTLSPREREITSLTSKGLTNAEIASCLGVSINTVKKHLKSLFEKAGVSSRAELTWHATRAGIS